MRERTWKRSEEIVRIHLVPVLGRTRLDRLNALHLQSLYRSKLDSGPPCVRVVVSSLPLAVVSSERVRPAPPCPAAHPARRKISISVISTFILEIELMLREGAD